MNKLENKIWFFFIIIFKLFSISNVQSAELLLKQKDIIINSNWEMKMKYRYQIKVISLKDFSQFNEIAIPVSNHSRYISDIFSFIISENKQMTMGFHQKNKILFKKLKLNSIIEYGFTAHVKYPGFEKFFADLFYLNNEMKLYQAKYSVTFPKRIEFYWKLIDSSYKQIEMKKNYSKTFSWKRNDVVSESQAAFLSISTIKEWNDIKQRYMLLYQKIKEKKCKKIKLLTKFCTNTNKQTTSTVLYNIMEYLRTKIKYAPNLDRKHCLIPDSPDEVIERKWGDCKDITLLCNYLLNQCRIKSFIVLVSRNTNYQNSKNFLPNPFIFDHAVIGLKTANGLSFYDVHKKKHRIHIENKKYLCLMEG